MSENSSPIETTNEPAGALSAPPSPTGTPPPGLWGRLSKTQKLCALVSGSVVTLVGGIAGYTKLTAKPAAPPANTVVAEKPSEKEPATPQEKEPLFTDVPPVPKPFVRDNDIRLPEVPVIPPVRTKQDDVPLLPVSDRPKIKDDFTSPKLPEIPEVPLVVPPKELPADLKSKNDVKEPLTLRPVRADETAPPPKKIDNDPLKLDLPAPPTPPVKVDAPTINIPPKPMGMMMDPPLLLPTPPTPMGMGTPKKDDIILIPPTPPLPMGMGMTPKKDDLLLAPPPPTPPLPMDMGMKKDDLILMPPPPTPPLPMGMGMKKDDLITPPMPPLPLNMGMGTPPMPPKKDDIILMPPTPPLPTDMGMKKEAPGTITIPMPPSKIDFPTIDPMLPPRKDTTPIQIDPVVTPKRESYEEDWHAPKPSDTFATISREYYKTTDYGAALEAYNKNYTKNADRIIRVPPTWVLREKFPDLVKDNSIDPKLPERIEKTPVAPRPELKFDPVEPPIIGGGARPAPPPAVEPVKSRTDEYRVSSAGGESIKEIARKVLGNADQWKRLYDLNPSIDPTEPIPSGTILRLSK